MLNAAQNAEKNAIYWKRCRTLHSTQDAGQDAEYLTLGAAGCCMLNTVVQVVTTMVDRTLDSILYRILDIG